jgi:hypothetical protein
MIAIRLRHTGKRRLNEDRGGVDLFLHAVHVFLDGLFRFADVDDDFRISPLERPRG